MTDSDYLWFDSQNDPKPVGEMRATGRRIVVRLEPHVEVDGDRVGIVQFGPDARWVRRTFNGFHHPPDSDAVRFIHVEDIRPLVRYCVKSDVEVTVNREFWTFAELLQ